MTVGLASRQVSARALRSVGSVRSNLKGKVRDSHYNASDSVKKVTLPSLYEKYTKGEPIAVLTAHDAISGRMADMAGVDVVLVGDSLAMVALGYEDTSEISLDDMIHHCRAVRRGSSRPFLIADLPFGSYEISPQQACESSLKMIKFGKAEMVKFEGGLELAPTVKHLSSYGIPCIPHIGLTPQRQLETGGFKVQGRTASSAVKILEEAIGMQEAGAKFLLLEGVPQRVGKKIQSKLAIPIIGIGAGNGTAGQVLVQLDMLGAFDAFQPKFLKRYASSLDTNVSAISKYVKEVREGDFPAPEHWYKIKDDEYAEFENIADRQF